MSAHNVILTILRDERGATAVEYGLILCMIVIAMITALQGFTNEVIGMWGKVSTEVQDAR